MDENKNKRNIKKENKDLIDTRSYHEEFKKSYDYPEPENPRERPLGAQPASQNKPSPKSEKKNKENE